MSTQKNQVPIKFQLQLKKRVLSTKIIEAPVLNTLSLVTIQPELPPPVTIQPKSPPSVAIQAESPPSVAIQAESPPSVTIQTELPPSLLKPISVEQQTIIDCVGQGYNVSVDAVAGSGKTTTSLYIAINNPSLSILLLTYNAKLKLETRVKVQSLGLDNVEVHSYHSFCVKYFYRKSYTDTGIIAFLKLNQAETCLKAFQYQLIIIDEAQDMNPVYYQVVHHILTRHEIPPRLVVMGDQKQSIYAFNNADSRFLSMSDQIFSSSYPWKQCTLSTSYRLTREMSNFINNCCSGALPIQTIKTGPSVRYLICDSFGHTPHREIITYLQHGYHPEDIFILTPSVKSEQSPVRRLANQLTNDGIAIYVPTSDEEKLDEEILHGKIVFSTFHQVKGLERPIVMVFNFDASYFKYYAKDIPSFEYTQIPNTIYVAITRATQRLIMIHDRKNNFFQFLHRSRLSQNCTLNICSGFHPPVDKNESSCRMKELKVTELVKYVPVDVLDRCMDYLTVERSNQPSESLDIPIKVKQDDLYEGVSEITGSAIPCYYEYMISKKLTIYEYLQNNKMNEIQTYLTGKKTTGCLLDDDNDNGESHLYDRLYGQMSQPVDQQDKCRSLLQLTTHWVCKKTGYDFKKKQIKQYDWLSDHVLEQALTRLDAKFPPETKPHLEFEKSLIVKYDSFVIVGFADIYNRQTQELWELKVVKEIDHTHLLQVAIYCWMINHTDPKPVQKIYLFNIMNDTQYIIDTDNSRLDNIIKILVDHRKQGQIKQNNTAFLERCQTQVASITEDRR